MRNQINREIVEEKGYVLIVVLLVVTLMILVSLSLIGVSLTHAQQISHEQSRVQATNASEVALKYCDKIIANKINELNNLSSIDENTFTSELSGLKDALVSNSSISPLAQLSNKLPNQPALRLSITSAPGSGTNSMIWDLSCTGKVNGVERTINERKTFTLNAAQSGSTTPLYYGLALPYIDGYFANSNPSWKSEGTLIHNGDYWNNATVYLSDQLITSSDTHHSAVDLSAVKELFLNMPLSYPANQQIAGASLNTESNINQPVYDSTNFNSFNLTLTNPNVTISGNAYINSSINTGSLQNGTITFNNDVAINGDLNASNNVKFIFNGNVFINGGINAGNNASMDFEKNLYINGSDINLNNTSSMYVGQNTLVQSAGSINGTGSAIFNGNVYFNNSYNSSGNNLFKGYVFINGDFNNSGSLTFQKTVYVKGNFYPKANGYTVNFEQGVITTGATASPSGNGTINIGQEQKQQNGTSEPVSVVTGNIRYQ